MKRILKISSINIVDILDGRLTAEDRFYDGFRMILVGRIIKIAKIVARIIENLVATKLLKFRNISEIFEY